MQDVPKIVRERLKAAKPAVHHPDADMLTAFAERSLPELERAVVLEHLGRCGDCRDVVAMAMPDAEVVGAPSPARGPWLTWPAIRLAFVAAGIVAVGAIGVMQYQKREPAMVASRQVTRTQATAPQASATEAKNETAPPGVPAPATREEKARKDLDGYSVPAPAATLAQGSGAGAGVRGATVARVEVPAVNTPQAFHSAIGGVASRPPSGGPKAPMQWQQNNTNAFQNQAAPPPAPVSIAKQAADSSLSLKSSAASQTVEVSGAAPVINTLDANQVQNQPTAPKAADDNAVGKAKAPVTVQAEAAAVQSVVDGAAPQELPVERSGGGGVVGRTFAQLVQAEPMIRWTVTSAGGLQRSFDRGNTWQDVNVNGVVAGGSMSYSVAAKTSRSKEKLADKKAASATVVFRAVAAIGAEVWAGGTGGALYHSSDAGSQWTRVVPSAGGTALTGDIVGVEFADAQNGKITTSTGEAWSTADTGQTWQKQ
jgi:photosystem II stability/assembly factor-like uncharacterized protein